MGKKKEKVIYVDDGRTLADMSGVSGPKLHRSSASPKVSYRDAWSTYWSTVKMMFLPMLAVIGALIVIYVVMYLLFLYA